MTLERWLVQGPHTMLIKISKHPVATRSDVLSFELIVLLFEGEEDREEEEGGEEWEGSKEEELREEEEEEEEVEKEGGVVSHIICRFVSRTSSIPRSVNS